MGCWLLTVYTRVMRLCLGQGPVKAGLKVVQNGVLMYYIENNGKRRSVRPID